MSDITIIKNARIVDAESDFYGSIVFSEDGIIEVAPDAKDDAFLARFPDATESACGAVVGGTGSCGDTGRVTNTAAAESSFLARFPNAAVIGDRSSGRSCGFRADRTYRVLLTQNSSVLAHILVRR